MPGHLGHLGQSAPWQPPTWANRKTAQDPQPPGSEPYATRAEALILVSASVPSDWKRFRDEVETLAASGLSEPEAARAAYLARYGVDLGPVDLTRVLWLWDDKAAPGGPRRPWRESLASWPDDWRARWGARANELEQDGLALDAAERQAFVEVSGHKRLAKS